MRKPTPLFVGLDIHKDSIAVAHAQGHCSDPPVFVGSIGTRQIEDEQVDRLRRIEAELLELAPTWRLYPVVQALQALRGVQWLVAITVVAEFGDLTRFDHPRQLAAYVGLISSEHSSGHARHQDGITKAANGRARRAFIEAAWAYRYAAKVSTHIQQRVDQLPKRIQDIGWKAQLRLCKRFRRLTAAYNEEGARRITVRWSPIHGYQQDQPSALLAPPLLGPWIPRRARRCETRSLGSLDSRRHINAPD